MTDDPVKQRIMEYSRERFFQLGFSKVTMDELAAGIGISKKTMYQHFRSKNELLDAVIEWNMIEIGGRIRAVGNSQYDYMERLHGMWTVIANLAAKVSKQFQDDLRRIRPDVWQRIDDYRRVLIGEQVTALIQDGIRLGMIRSDTSTELLVLIHFSAIQGIINPEVLTTHSFSMSEAVRGIIRVIMQGMLTEEGRKRSTVVLEKIVNQQ